MCGIMGLSFKKNTISTGRRAVFLTNLARLNDIRGGHSWGLLGFQDDGGIRVKRGLGDLVKSAYELVDYNMLFAHTRFATTGARTIRNAHPFEHDHIIGAHNGTIGNHRELSNRYKRNFEVDSQHLFAHLAENKDFNEIEGYGAIEWYDRNEPDSLFLSKMRNGSLAVYGIGEQDNVRGVVWSSDWKHLEEALECAGIKKHFPYKVEEGNVYLIKNGDFYQLSRRLELKAPSYTNFNHRSWSPYDDHFSGGNNNNSSSTVGNNKSWDWQKAGNDDRDLTDWKAWNEFCLKYKDEDDNAKLEGYTG